MEETPGGVLGESSYRVSGLLGNSLNPLQVSEKMVSAGLAKKQRRFSKLDLTAIILDKGLTSKAALLAYVQDHGTEEMQAFVHTNQKKLKEFLDEAAEWDRARSDTRMEAETDWELVCRIAEGSCCHGEVCSFSGTSASCSSMISGQWSTRKRRCRYQHFLVCFKGSLWKSRCPKPFTMVMWTSSGTEAAS